jgi:alpha-glucosidase (family GH31 glycosyl hydrolase)
MTDPAARLWWWGKHPPFLGRHVAGLWTDLGEPERHPGDMRHFLGTTEKVHNIYNILWAKTVFEGMSRFRPGERIFNLTRSGSAGVQRYGVIPWSGDVSRSFAGLEVQLPMLLNMGMSGLAYHNSDIGGYARNPTTPELYIRWMEFGVFSPVTRAHGAGEVVHGAATEPWQFGPEAEGICREMLRLRYRLLPYNYTMAYRNYETGLPLARPLVMMYPGDGRFTDESSSYLWGGDFLVSPVVEPGQTTKRVVFPEGEWVNFWTDELVHGGKTLQVSAPLGRIPLFVKSGSIIPLAPPMAYSDERFPDTLTLSVYPESGKADSSFLYEDDGKTTAYQTGSYSLAMFRQSSVKENGLLHDTFGIGAAIGQYTGKRNKRTYAVEFHRVSDAPAGVRINGKDVPEVSLLSGTSSAGTGYRFDPRVSRLTVFVPCNTDSAYTLSVSFPLAR